MPLMWTESTQIRISVKVSNQILTGSEYITVPFPLVLCTALSSHCMVPSSMFVYLF